MGEATSQNGYSIGLTERRLVAEGTMAFHFDKPAGFVFTPGQFVDLTLTEPSETDAAGNTRAFSLASAPQEPTLMVATRLRDTAFKRELQRMPIGSTVKMEGPFGKLVLHADQTRTAVFLAGGIGITPFRSMAVHAALQRAPHRMVLFYSNRRPEDAPFLDELQALQEKNPHYRFVGTLTEPATSSRPWQGETGYLNAALLAKHLVNIEKPIYYVVGPPGMVVALRAMLKEAGIDDSDIRTEKFAGY
ncbi:MAG: FAD-dependent oxidoreductase [Nitrospira sp.]|nr:FAD-dependent oxidoreductase [Nitrospira sp.]